MAARAYVYPFYQNSTLLTLSFVTESAGRGDSYLGLAVFHILLASWIGLANSSQIINVILSPGLRGQPKNILVCNVCLAELIMGVFLCPLYTDTLLQGIWRHSLGACAVYELTFYGQVCVATLAMLVLAVERLYFRLTPSMMEGSGSRGFTAVLVLLPWLVGAGLVGPIFTFGTAVVQGEDSNPCQLLWKPKFQAVVVFVSFMCPALLLLSVVAGLHFLHITKNVQAKCRDLGPHPEKKAFKESLQVTALAAAVCVTLQLPLFILLVKAVLCQQGGNANSCGIDTASWSVAMASLMLKSGVMPVVWLAYTDVRVWFRQGLVGTLCASKDVPAMDDQGNDAESTIAAVGNSRQAILQSSVM
ncbi:hypothetical protein EGW08_011509 [Elysia chlorotica]|uniref:G-protein coupled receptors family 1 profile domain-containing protein n=1 Tax=Elysia chlorotica TaxID=188477 RepID=A0A3S1C201_ELYCH|nr:hypothetical protein EGW08_011509 [Elysia chlorotica]